MAAGSWIALAGLSIATAQAARPVPLVPGPQASASAAPSALLRPVPEGYRWDGARVIATVRPDGFVTFARKGKKTTYLPFDPQAVLPRPLPPGTPTLESALLGLKGKRPRRARAGAEGAARPDVPGPVLVDVCQDFRDTRCIPQGWNVLLVGAAGTHDLAGGNFDKADPDREEKARFLAVTSELRDELARRARQEALRDGVLELHERLAAVWRDPEPSAAAKRETLFRLWLESDATTTEGQRARATVLAFIRERLPSGGHDAFTGDELRRAQREPGGEAFTPYGPRAQADAPGDVNAP